MLERLQRKRNEHKRKVKKWSRRGCMRVIA
jgi:hypothetical protein